MVDAPDRQPPDAAARADALLEQVLSRREVDWQQALDAACDDHPDLAAELRRRCHRLLQFDLLPASAAAPAPLATQFGRFELLGVLGAGGMGVVYRAHDTEHDREVALKVLRPEQFDLPQARRRFLREAAAATRLEHPALCAVHDAGEIDGSPYLAMRYVEGASLAERIGAARGGRRGARFGSAVEPGPGVDPDRSVRTAARLVAAVAHGVQAVHDAGLVHRDIKPGNVLVTADGEPVLVDFGLVRDSASSSLTRSGALLGTPAYMAPEQVRGGEVDARTDVYALCATLFECVTLRPPHDAVDRENLFRQILADEPPSATKCNLAVPRDLATVLAKGLDKDPARRYPTARELAQDLERVAAGQPVAARRPGPVRRACRWTGRHPTAAAVMAALALGLVGVLGALRQVDIAHAVTRAHLLASTARGVAHTNPVAAALLAQQAVDLHDDSATRSARYGALARVREVGSWRPGNEALATVNVVRVAPTGTRFACLVGGDLWIGDGRLQNVHRLGAGIGFPGSLEWSADGRLLVAATSRGARVHQRAGADDTFGPEPWSVIEGNFTAAFDISCEQHLVAFSADGRSLALGQRSGELAIVDLADRSVVRIKAHDGPIQAVCAVPLAQGSPSFVTASLDGTAALWTRQGARWVPDGLGAQWQLQWVAAAVDAAGTWLALGAATGEVVRFALGPAAERAGTLLQGLTGRVTVLAFEPDGPRLLAADKDSQARIWHPDGEVVPTRAPPCGPLWTGRWCAGGARIVLGPLVLDDQLRVIEEGRRSRHVLTCDLDDQGRLWTGDWEGVVRCRRIVDPEFRTLLGHRSSVRAGVWSAQGLLTASIDRELRSWSAGWSSSAQDCGQGNLWCAAASADGRLVATGGNAGVLKVWSTTAAERLDLYAAAAEVEPDDIVFSACWTAAGQLLSAHHHNVKLWQLAAPGLHLVRNVMAARQARTLVVSDRQGLVAAADISGRVQVTTLTGAGCGAALVLPARPGSGALHPDGRLLAIPVDDGSIWMVAIDRDGPRYLGMLTGHEIAARCVAFAPDGQWLVAGGADGTIRIWRRSDWEQGRPAWVVVDNGRDRRPVLWVAVSPDSSRFASSGVDTAVRLWSLPTEAAIERLWARLPRHELTADERRRHDDVLTR